MKKAVATIDLSALKRQWLLFDQLQDKQGKILLLQSICKNDEIMTAMVEFIEGLHYTDRSHSSFYIRSRRHV